MNQVSLRAAILEYWTEKVVALGLPRAKHCELIRGTKNQRLYWLMFLQSMNFHMLSGGRLLLWLSRLSLIFR